MNITNEIFKIISEKTGRPIEDMDVNDSLFHDFDLDSIQVLEILEEVENKFQITIDIEKMILIIEISDMIQLVEEYK